MTDRELMQQALEALERERHEPGTWLIQQAAITALRERLAQPAIPEGYALIGIDALKAWGKYDLVRDACQYPLAQPEQEPVAWVKPDGEIVVCTDYGGRLYYSEQNVYTTPPRRELVLECPHCGSDQSSINRTCARCGKFTEAFAQNDVRREWVGLTNDDLKPICDEYRILFGGWVHDFARAIEAKLKEKNA